MEWLIFILVAWAAVRFLGVGRCRGEWLERRRLAERSAGAGRVSPPPADKAVPAAETLEAKLRRRYVAGELTVEQYERELDALYRRDG
jgi:hypothetical protein